MSSIKVEKVIGVREGSKQDSDVCESRREYLVIRQGSDDGAAWIPESQLSDRECLLAIDKYKSTVEEQLKTLLTRKSTNSQVPVTNSVGQDLSGSLTLCYQHKIANEFLDLCMEKQLQEKSENKEEKPKQNEFKCTVCNFVGSNLQNLKRHLNVHLDIKPFSCSYCGTRYKQKADLKRHVSIKHTQTAPKFECEHCKKIFGRKSELNRHVSTIHKKPASNECKCCKIKFESRLELEVHIAANHFACKLCPNLVYYARKADLKVHNTNKHNEKDSQNFKCAICNSSFNWKKDLKRHERQAHSFLGEPLQCDACKEVFFEKWAFFDHQKHRRCFSIPELPTILQPEFMINLQREELALSLSTKDQNQGLAKLSPEVP